MKLKRLISLFAALAMLAAFVPTLAFAAGGTYTLDNIICPANTSGVGAYATLLSPVTGSVTIEFDYTPYGVQNNWIYISNGQSLWGAGAIGIGSDDDTTGHFKTQSSGTYLGYITANTTYHVTIETTVSNHTYTVTMDDGSGSVWTNTDSYRTASDSLDTIVVSTNGASSSFALTNITVNDPNIEFEEYTVKYVDTDGIAISADGTYTTTYDNTLGYNDEVICPYVDIPYFEGYIFTSKSVDTSNSVITLTYTATSVVDEASGMTNFFSNVSNSAPFISLNMLGAHDAFTSGMGDAIRMDAAGTTQGDSGSSYATAAAGSYASTVRNISRAQDKTALELLEAGVRYFDVRLSRSTSTASASYYIFLNGTAPHTNGVFYTTHGLLSDEFRPIAFTIGQWLKEHPGEIVVLDFQEVWDNTSSGSSGNATASTWADFYDMIEEAGIADFVNYDYNTDISTVTYGGLTNGGTEAGAVLFGRAVGYTQGKFYLRGDTSGAFNGTLYSNYDKSSVSIGTTFSEDYIDAQVSYLSEKSGDHAIATMARVMQAQSEGSNLLSQASTDNDALYEALTNNTHTDWLTALPIVMINGAGNGEYAKELTALLKAANEPASLTATYTDSNGDTLFTLASDASIGTLYISAENTVVNNGSDTYLTTSAYASNTTDGEILPIPAIYDADNNTWTSKITIPVTESTPVEETSSTFTVQNGALYTGNLTDDGTYTGKKDFGAFNWGAKYSHDRIGVAVLDNSLQNTNAASYTLDATLARSYTNSSDFSVQLYAITYDEYRSMSLADLSQKLTDENLIADFTPSGTAGETVSIDLDADIIAETVASDSSDRLVILGNSNNGLYALAGSTITISYEGEAATGIEVVQTSSALTEGSFTAAFTIKNHDSTSLSANAYLAVYDENGDLKDADVSVISLDPASETEVTFTIDGAFTSTDTAKFFLWNGELNPLTDISELSVE
ncbi:MAG: hypothetical protein LUG52_09450 [Clostridia bacterium]|nr:hypothetical protein [Clostridia bacterium]